jgi:predicted kinase
MRQHTPNADFFMQNRQGETVMKAAVILIGIPASGKSSFYERFFQCGYVRINLDTLHTRKKEHALLAECLAEGKSFVVDNTNPTKADRKRFIAPAKAAGYRVDGYFLQSVLKDCIARNEKREGKARVPAKAIAAISNKLEMPSMDEGFDRLFFVTQTGGDFKVEEWRNDA